MLYFTTLVWRSNWTQRKTFHIFGESKYSLYVEPYFWHTVWKTNTSGQSSMLNEPLKVKNYNVNPKFSITSQLILHPCFLKHMCLNISALLSANWPLGHWDIKNRLVQKQKQTAIDEDYLKAPKLLAQYLRFVLRRQLALWMETNGNFSLHFSHTPKFYQNVLIC